MLKYKSPAASELPPPSVDGLEDAIWYLSVKLFTFEILLAAVLILEILFAAVFELLFKHNNPKKVIINEYLQASEYFLEKVQIGYLNAILDKLSNAIRKDE